MAGLEEIEQMAAEYDFSYLIERFEMRGDHVVVHFREMDDDDRVPETRILHIDPTGDGIGEIVMMILHQLCQLVDQAYVNKRNPPLRVRPGQQQ